MGLFLGATGARICGYDCKRLGLTDFVLRQDDLGSIKKNLLTMPLALDVEDDLNAEFEELASSNMRKAPSKKITS